MRLAALVAAIAAAVDLLVLGLLHFVSPEVDPMSRPVSEYALGDFGWLAAIGTVAQGVGAIALAVALRRQRAAAMLLLVFGLMKLALPLFPVDALGAPATSAGRVHNWLGNLTFWLFPVAALGAAGAIGNDRLVLGISYRQRDLHQAGQVGCAPLPRPRCAGIPRERRPGGRPA
jgi:Protein of unknown function (DUF998)